MQSVLVGKKKNGFCVQARRRTPAVAEAGTGPGITAELVISPGLTGEIPRAREPQIHKTMS